MSGQTVVRCLFETHAACFLLALSWGGVTSKYFTNGNCCCSTCILFLSISCTSRTCASQIDLFMPTINTVLNNVIFIGTNSPSANRRSILYWNRKPFRTISAVLLSIQKDLLAPASIHIDFSTTSNALNDAVVPLPAKKKSLPICNTQEMRAFFVFVPRYLSFLRYSVLVLSTCL